MSVLIQVKTVTAGYITGGPKCYCGYRDWFPKGDNIWICSECARTRQSQHIGIILNGPKCYCGHRDWFVGASGIRCAECDRWRDTKGEVIGYILDGPKCYCGHKDWIVGNSVYRCTECDRVR